MDLSQRHGQVGQAQAMVPLGIRQPGDDQEFAEIVHSFGQADSLTLSFSKLSSMKVVPWMRASLL